MKHLPPHRPATLALAVAIAAGGLGLLSATSTLSFAQTEPAAGGDHDAAHEAFEGSMRQLGQAWRGLRGAQWDEASREANLAAIVQLEEGLMQAKANIAGVDMSPRAKEQYGEDTDAYHAALRSQLIDTLASTLLLEQAVVLGDGEAAQKAFDVVNQQQREGHSMFRGGRDNMGRPGGNRGGEGGGNREGGMGGGRPQGN